MTQPSVSVIIPNYNYEAFVGKAIESALHQTTPPAEVIVVDDGSTDASLSVIERYADRAVIIEQENGGMASAMNAGFERASGDLVIFLDADDFLHPTCVETVIAADRPGCAKIHWPLRLVDAREQPLGRNPAPGWRLATGDVREELCRTGDYSTVPTSANCYTRRALDQLMPIPEAEFLRSGDSYLNLGVAFVGTIIAVEQELSSYRVHGANHSTGSQFTADHLRVRLAIAETKDRWLPMLAERFAATADLGIVLGHPEFRLMRMLLDREGQPSHGRLRQLAAGLRTAVAALRSRSIRPRRRLLIAVLAPLLPVLPGALVNHVQQVAYGGAKFVPKRR